MPRLTQSRLRSLLSYDPRTGEFRWLVNRGGQLPGAAAGYVNGADGYVKIRVCGVKYQAHRLAFLYVTGHMPKEVDHRNRVRTDNRWRNLRAATTTQNRRNSSPRRNNTGYTGVCFDKSRGLFMAHITVGYKHHNLGRFKTAEAALSVRRSAERKIFGEFRPVATADPVAS